MVTLQLSAGKTLTQNPDSSEACLLLTRCFGQTWHRCQCLSDRYWVLNNKCCYDDGKVPLKASRIVCQPSWRRFSPRWFKTSHHYNVALPISRWQASYCKTTIPTSCFNATQWSRWRKGKKMAFQSIIEGKCIIRWLLISCQSFVWQQQQQPGLVWFGLRCHPNSYQ